MPAPAQTEFLILGQGLAGSLLAWRLLRAGRRVLVVDDGHRSASSRVAAGLINPLAGIRFNPPAHIHELLASTTATYGELAEQFGHTYLHWLPMRRLFRSQQQIRFFERQRDNPDCRDLLGETFSSAQVASEVQAPFGGFMQGHTGYVDLPAVLADVRRWLQAQGALVERALDPAALQPGAHGVRWRDLAAATCICCEGWRVIENPWFDWLPHRPLKGELLLLEKDDHGPPQHCIDNGAHWLVPLQQGGYRFGATHEHGALDLAVTETASKQLREGLHTMYPERAFRVSAQLAGIRPGTADRGPLLGPHPAHPRLWICNGFGARGALSIPWYSEACANTLLQDQPLPPEADIHRFCR